MFRTAFRVRGGVYGGFDIGVSVRVELALCGSLVVLVFDSACFGGGSFMFRRFQSAVLVQPYPEKALYRDFRRRHSHRRGNGHQSRRYRFHRRKKLFGVQDAVSGNQESARLQIFMAFQGGSSVPQKIPRVRLPRTGRGGSKRRVERMV